MTELLLNTNLDNRQQHYADTAYQSGKNLLAIINDILDFSKIEAGKMELESVEFNLRDLIDELGFLYAEQASRHQLELVFSIPPQLHPVYLGDPVRLRQVLSNLLSNALKFTEHGQVVLRVIPISENASEELKFEVEDTGIGISADKLEHIFTSFAQADGSTTRRYGGTGLGLSIARQLIDMMGGELKVQSELAKGSCFSFSIVLPQVHGTELPQPALLHQLPTLGFSYPYRLLVAEDNQVNQEVALIMLESFGLKVDLVEHGLEALEAVRSHTYDLILMDMQMPRMDGLEATRQIRMLEQSGELASGMPIIALTANAMEGDMERCLEAGMNGYLSKPFSAEQLYEVLTPWLLTPRSISEPVIPSPDAEKDQDDDIMPVDPTALDKIAALKPSEPDALVNKVIGLFLDTLGHTLAHLQQAGDESHAEQLRSLAHCLKSSSANVGANQLSALCKQLEEAAATQSLTQLPELIARIEQESHRVRNYFAERSMAIT